MAVAVKRGAQPGQTGLRMNALFFASSLVIFVIMGISMWVDNNPSWLKYPKEFAVIEKSVLTARRDDLLRQLNHPDYDGDYLAARDRYEKSKQAYDTVSATLDQTDSDLEEAELSVKAASGEGEEGGGGGEQAAAASGASKPSQPASKSELDELDKEFDSGGGGGGSAAPAPASAKQSAPAKASKKELDDLDKEFADEGGSSKPPKPAAQPSKRSTSSTASKSELDDLDKEFASPGAPKAPSESRAQPTDTTQAKPAAETLTYEEARFDVNPQAADAQVEGAKRNLLNQQRTHSREMIGLPQDATKERQLADLQLKEAQQTLDLAVAGQDLEEKKVDVKKAAQIAMWARDATILAKGTQGMSSDKVTELETSKKNLEDHIQKLQRELNTIESRLAKNGSAPEIQQIFCERLGSVERCETCHLAVEDPLFKGQKEPFAYHPAQILKTHPLDKFGCVSCHGGWGSALDKDEAHGSLIGKGRPLLTGDRIQSSCGKCHGDSQQLSGESAYLAGSDLFKTSGCLGCHKVAGIDSDVKVGPDLNRVAEKVRPEWLAPWVKNPKSHSLDARMPNLGLTDDQAVDVATYLLTQDPDADVNKPISMPTFAPTDLSEGKRLVDTLGCMGCHTIQGKGGTFGPELTNLRSKVRPEWLYKWLENPKAYLPDGRMPVFGLTQDQCRQIGNYLLSIGTEKTYEKGLKVRLSDSAAATAGAKLIADKGCAGCHDIKGFAKMAAPDLSREGDVTWDLLEFGNSKIKKNAYTWLVQKIEDPSAFNTDKITARMPKFGLDESDAQNIAIFLQSLTGQEYPPEYEKGLLDQNSPLIAGAKIIQKHDCMACHSFSGQGGKIGPDLTREGERVEPTWLFKFLKSPFRIRWWEDARMPNFHLSDEEATNITEYFMALSNQPEPYEYTPPDKMVYPLASAGANYFLDLKCQSCHPIGGKQAVAGGDTKKLGPDLGMAQARLKPDWIFRFLKDPQSISPGTQMPTFGKPDYMYQAIVDFLMKGPAKQP